MTTVTLGKTGITVNKNGFGALPIQRITKEEAAKLLRKAYDGGITYFDTARAYSDSEEKIGYALSDVRNHIYLATKTAAKTADEFWKDLETSLRLLKTDCIDVYQFHNPAVCPKPGDESGLYDAALKAREQGKIRFVGDDCKQALYEAIESRQVRPGLCKTAGLKLVYSPLNGSGLVPVTQVLKDIGITDITIVPEQEYPNGYFTTCSYPNPEIFAALELGLNLAKETGADLMLATDPDADRVGIAVPDGDDYALFSGNEVGAMLLEYICQQRIEKGTMPKNPIAVKTIVTTDIVNAIAKEYGVEVIDVLTGFKFIGEQIGFLEEKGEEDRYIFGFEESYGYLAGSYVRDKDAVVASMLICEMAAYYRTKGISMIEARKRMYEKYGVYVHSQHSFTFEGESGMIEMQNIMTKLRNEHPTEINGLKVVKFDDYQTSVSKDLTTGEKTEITLPKSNVLAFTLEQGAKVVIRPSGTEPKIKAYYTVTADTNEEGSVKEKALDTAFSAMILN